MSTIYGDPIFLPTLLGNQNADDQFDLIGEDNQGNVIVGDVDFIIDHAWGGDDTLFGGNVRSRAIRPFFNAP